MHSATSPDLIIRYLKAATTFSYSSSVADQQLTDMEIARQQQLDNLIARNLAAVRSALVQIEKRRCARECIDYTDAYVTLPQKDADRKRLLNLLVWSRRYNVTVEFILGALLNYFKNFRKPSSGLGLAVVSLTGIRARQIVEEAVVNAYPAGENETAARQAQRNKILGISGMAMKDHGGDIDKMVASYSRTMRDRHRTALDTEQFNQRPWRGNPWRHT